MVAIIDKIFVVVFQINFQMSFFSDWFNCNCTEEKECLVLMIYDFNVKNELY